MLFPSPWPPSCNCWKFLDRWAQLCNFSEHLEGWEAPNLHSSASFAARNPWFFRSSEIIHRLDRDVNRWVQHGDDWGSPMTSELPGSWPQVADKFQKVSKPKKLQRNIWTIRDCTRKVNIWLLMQCNDLEIFIDDRWWQILDGYKAEVSEVSLAIS